METSFDLERDGRCGVGRPAPSVVIWGRKSVDEMRSSRAFRSDGHRHRRASAKR